MKKLLAAAFAAAIVLTSGIAFAIGAAATPPAQTIIYPPIGRVLWVGNTDIATTYTAAETSATIEAGRPSRLWLWVHVTTATGSSLTTITVKVQERYADPDVTFAWTDFPTYKGDASNAREVEHTFAVAANGTYDFAPFYVDSPGGLSDLQVMVHGSAAGVNGDSVAIYASAAP